MHEVKVAPTTKSKMKTVLPNYLLLLISLMACVDGHQRETDISPSTQLVNYLSEPIRPLTNPITDSEKVRLGELLFHDTRLSINQSTSCASCHSLEKGGADRRNMKIGINGELGEVNVPSVLNAIHNFRQSWDGKSETLDEKIEEVIRSETGMNTNWVAIIGNLAEVPGYVSQFKKVYDDKISAEYIKDALIAFQASLATPSRFDDYLLGDRNAISMDEKVGYLKFKEYGCSTCHQGINVGGNMFQKMGVVKDYFQNKTAIRMADYGRYNITQKVDDKFVFKVPSLRNVALTAPYLHDGSVADLKEVIHLMGSYQLGKKVSDKDAQSIYLFLKSLTAKAYETDPVAVKPIATLSDNISY